MKRREFVKTAGISSAALAFPTLVEAAAAKAATGRPGQDEEHEHGHDGDRDDMTGPLALATMAFGEWNTDPVIDRFPNNSPRTQNNHFLLPAEVTIKTGGAVSFLIGGFHHLLVYKDRKPSDINIAALIPTTVQPGPPLINDPVNRVYRGLDPSVMPALPGSTPPQPLQDRVEVVRFQQPGRYLVICGVLPHFFDVASGQFIMFGYVRVLP